MAKKVNEYSAEKLLKQVLVPENEQPYEVPANWCWTTIEHMCNLKSGTTYPIERELESGKIKYIKIADMNLDENQIEITTSSRYIDEYKLDHLIPVPSIIFPKRGGAILTNKKRLVLKDEILVDLNTMAMIPKNKEMIKYLYYWFLSLDLGELNNGSTVPQINNKDINPLKIPLPPLAEQKRIVEQIEGIFSKLDNAKEIIEDLLSTFKLTKTMILFNAFCGNLTNDWRKKNNLDLSNWNNSILENETFHIGDGLHGTPIYDEDGDYYFVNGNNFDGEKIIFKDDTKKVNKVEYIKYKKNLDADSTVFVSINGTLGKTAIYTGEKIVLGKSACYINVKPSLNRKYLCLFLQSKEFIDYANENATGTTIKNLGLKAIRQLPIKVPSIEEQNAIVSIVEELLTKEFEAQTLMTVLDDIDKIKKAILAKAFRGELSTTDLSEPSSLVLLKEILSE